MDNKMTCKDKAGSKYVRLADLLVNMSTENESILTPPARRGKVKPLTRSVEK